jgi:hypothetical protein
VTGRQGWWGDELCKKAKVTKQTTVERNHGVSQHANLMACTETPPPSTPRCQYHHQHQTPPSPPTCNSQNLQRGDGLAMSLQYMPNVAKHCHWEAHTGLFVTPPPPHTQTSPNLTPPPPLQTASPTHPQNATIATHQPEQCPYCMSVRPRKLGGDITPQLHPPSAPPATTGMNTHHPALHPPKG